MNTTSHVLYMCPPPRHVTRPQEDGVSLQEGSPAERRLLIFESTLSLSRWTLFERYHDVARSAP